LKANTSLLTVSPLGDGLPFLSTSHQAFGYRHSSRSSVPSGQYQFILLGDRGTYVNNLPSVVT